MTQVKVKMVQNIYRNNFDTLAYPVGMYILYAVPSYHRKLERVAEEGYIELK